MFRNLCRMWLISENRFAHAISNVAWIDHLFCTMYDLIQHATCHKPLSDHCYEYWCLTYWRLWCIYTIIPMVVLVMNMINQIYVYEHLLVGNQCLFHKTVIPSQLLALNHPTKIMSILEIRAASSFQFIMRWYRLSWNGYWISVTSTFCNEQSLCFNLFSARRQFVGELLVRKMGQLHLPITNPYFFYTPYILYFENIIPSPKMIIFIE